MMSRIKKYISSIESAGTCESRILSLIQKIKQDTLNASVNVLEVSAYNKAKASSQHFEMKNIRALEGVPFAVKDMFLQEGEVATAASRMLNSYISPYTATVIKKLEEAGAIVLTRDNCDMFGHGNTNENSYYGAVRNALDRTKVAGGSSGGTAVNVAEGNVVFGIASDTGGSIRQPAVLNGVYGFKPSYGKISRYGLMAYASSLDTVGLIAHDVDDIIKVFNIVGGQDENDLTTIPHVHLVDEVVQNFQIAGKRIAYYRQFLDYPYLDSDIKENIQATLQALEDKGAKIVELDFFAPDLLVSTYYTIASAESASNLARLDGINFGYRDTDAKTTEEVYMLSRKKGLSEETKKRIVLGSQVLSEGDGAKLYRKALQARMMIEEAFRTHFEEADFILSPVVPFGAKSLGETSNEVDGYMADLYTVGFSLGKLPSLAIPTKKGIGFQITGAYNQDNDVLCLGKYLEKCI